MKPESPEDLACALRAETEHVRLDPQLTARIVARVARHEALERPAFLVLAFAASAVLWLSFGVSSGAANGTSELEDESTVALDLEEGLL